MLHQKLRKSYHNLKFRSKELAIYLKALNKKESTFKNKFFIFGQGRTGSTLLCSLLNSHPQIFADLEILFNHVYFPEYYVESKSKLNLNSVYGFKVKCYQLTRKQNINNPRQFVVDLINNNWKMIYLKRNNLFRHAISNIMAKKRGYFHLDKNQNKPSSEKIYIDYDDLMQRMTNREKYLEIESKILEGLNYIEIVYEEDLINPLKHQTTVDKIYNFLGIQSYPISTNLQRTVPDNISSLIQNYDEIVSSLKDTKYANFLP